MQHFPEEYSAVELQTQLDFIPFIIPVFFHPAGMYFSFSRDETLFSLPCAASEFFSIFLFSELHHFIQNAVGRRSDFERSFFLPDKPL
jgi:hypothetical protein